ncbi:MAG: hypothetical protein PF480_00690, partial [Roseovarius sp.]|nr:hypothetical protein [Roseovarius sp.]
GIGCADKPAEHGKFGQQFRQPIAPMSLDESLIVVTREGTGCILRGTEMRHQHRTGTPSSAEAFPHHLIPDRTEAVEQGIGKLAEDQGVDFKVPGARSKRILKVRDSAAADWPPKIHEGAIHTTFDRKQWRVPRRSERFRTLLQRLLPANGLIVARGGNTLQPRFKFVLCQVVPG